MGLSVLVAFKPLIDSVSTAAVVWIVAEGVCYITGALFYSLNKRKYMHSVFHFFVLAGSVCHIVAVWDVLMEYVQEKPAYHSILPEGLQLREGDVVFRRGGGMVSHVVVAADREGNYSHVGIVVDSAGVPMVVSDLPEMASVVRRFNIGAVIDGSGAQSLAEAVKRVLAREWSEADFAEARKDMDWNKEKQKLLEIIGKI
jgi:hypothetical protein